MKSANTDLQNGFQIGWNRALPIIIQTSALQRPIGMEGSAVTEAIDLNRKLRIGFAHRSVCPRGIFPHGVPRVIMMA